MKKLLNFLKNKYVLFSIQFLIATAITVSGFYYSPTIKKKYRIYQHTSLIKDFISALAQYPNTHMHYVGINNFVVRKEYEKKFDGRLIFHPDNNIEHVSGGYFLIYPNSIDYRTYRDDAFVLSYINLDMERCLELATYDWTKVKNVNIIGVMAASRSTQLNFESVYKGCDGVAVREDYTIACPNGKNISIPMPEEKALTACRCNGSFCSISFKAY